MVISSVIAVFSCIAIILVTSCRRVPIQQPVVITDNSAERHPLVKNSHNDQHQGNCRSFHGFGEVSPSPKHFHDTDSYRRIGTLRSDSGRIFALMIKKHPSRRWRYMYNAISSDLNTEMSFTVQVNGNDATDMHGLGSPELFTGDIVHLPEMAEAASVFITHRL